MFYVMLMISVGTERKGQSKTNIYFNPIYFTFKIRGNKFKLKPIDIEQKTERQQRKRQFDKKVDDTSTRNRIRRNVAKRRSKLRANRR